MTREDSSTIPLDIVLHINLNYYYYYPNSKSRRAHRADRVKDSNITANPAIQTKLANVQLLQINADRVHRYTANEK